MAFRRLLAEGGDEVMGLKGVAGVLIGVELEAVELEEVELDLLATCIDESGLPVDRGLPRADDDDIPPPVLLCLNEPERVGFMLWKSSGAGSVGDERVELLDEGECSAEEESSAGLRMSVVRVARASMSSSWQRCMHISRFMASRISERSFRILSSSNMKVWGRGDVDLNGSIRVTRALISVHISPWKAPKDSAVEAGDVNVAFRNQMCALPISKRLCPIFFIKNFCSN